MIIIINISEVSLKYSRVMNTQEFLVVSIFSLRPGSSSSLSITPSPSTQLMWGVDRLLSSLRETHDNQVSTARCTIQTLAVDCSFGVCILKSPFRRSLNGAILVSFPMIRDFLVKRIVQIWCGHQSLDRKQDSSDLQCGTPFIFQDVKANTTYFNYCLKMSVRIGTRTD